MGFTWLFVHYFPDFSQILHENEINLDLRGFMHPPPLNPLWIRHWEGPSTKLFGTPEETGIVLEMVPLVTTDCFLLSKKSLIHLRVSPWYHKHAVFEKKFFVGDFVESFAEM